MDVSRVVWKLPDGVIAGILSAVGVRASARSRRRRAHEFHFDITHEKMPLGINQLSPLRSYATFCHHAATVSLCPVVRSNMQDI